jgi:hypothetical protein
VSKVVPETTRACLIMNHANWLPQHVGMCCW